MIIQILIAVMSLTATYLSLHRLESRRRYACLFGIAVQPLWLISTVGAHQWGMVVLTFVYGALYVCNAWRYWGPKARL